MDKEKNPDVTKFQNEPSSSDDSVRSFASPPASVARRRQRIAMKKDIDCALDDSDNEGSPAQKAKDSTDSSTCFPPSENTSFIEKPQKQRNTWGEENDHIIVDSDDEESVVSHKSDMDLVASLSGDSSVVSKVSTVIPEWALGESYISPSSASEVSELQTTVIPEWALGESYISPSSASEVSELQTKVKVMEESQLSTKEELQATLLELAEFQFIIDELRERNSILEEENALLIRTLSSVTEKIHKDEERTKSRTDLSVEDDHTPERERKLIELLKNGQDQRKLLLKKEAEQFAKVGELNKALEVAEKDRNRLEERLHALQQASESAMSEKVQLQLKFTELATKFEQLQNQMQDEQAQTLQKKMATSASSLKDSTLAQDNQKEIANLINLVKRLKESQKSAREEARSNWKIIQELKEKLAESQAQLRESCHLREEEVRSNQKAKNEWKNFQKDLLVAIKVADEIKTNAQDALAKAEERIKELEMINSSLKSKTETVTVKDEAEMPTLMKAPSLEFTVPRQPPQRKFSRPSIQNVNVRSLIQHIENQSLPKQAPEESHSVSEECSPQREMAPLRDHRQITSNRQTPNSPPVISTCDEKKDPFHKLMVGRRGSLHNALLKWCETKTSKFENVEIINFSSSWTDGLALCALLASYMPNKICFSQLSPHDKINNFKTAFTAAESMGIPPLLNLNDVVGEDRPDWVKVMGYVKEIYKKFENE